MSNISGEIGGQPQVRYTQAWKQNPMFYGWKYPPFYSCGHWDKERFIFSRSCDIEDNYKFTKNPNLHQWSLCNALAGVSPRST